LPGTQIPLAARIFSIVDVWNVLHSDTVYRPAWEDDQVLDYLKDQAGKQFDPELVPLFLGLL
jgi:response regulator RpfG family c-di-GMP phosphodiesterase